MKGFMVAAPHSGSGKTVITLALLRALKNRGLSVASAKAGPDYIDPAFHAAASGAECVNLDPWAMRPELLNTLSRQWLGDADVSIIEAMMGLFDGAADGSGSAADLAAHLGFPVVLVVDASRMAHSVAALVKGYRDHRADLRFAGVILNRVGSARHETMLRTALDEAGVPVLGAVPASDVLGLPSRHLGLVQAGEHSALEGFIAAAADHVGKHCDLDALIEPSTIAHEPADSRLLPPPGQRIAIARDDAFAFSYPHLLWSWRSGGAHLSFFSPLADEAPDKEADAVLLPGGYPELHAGRIASAGTFKSGLGDAVRRGAFVYGECGGYMVLGEGLVDSDGVAHAMTGHLPLVTSFSQRKRHLGYRVIEPLVSDDDWPWPFTMRGHEFHYSTVEREGDGDRLFAVRDAQGNDLGHVGLRRGKVCGSYIHLIDGQVP